METSTIEFILRMLSTIFIIPTVYELWKVVDLINNKQFVKIMKKIGFSIVFFILANFLGIIIDYYLQFGITIFGYIITLGFWVWVAYYMHHQRIIFQSEQLGNEGRRRVSKSINDIINEMKQTTKFNNRK